MKNSLFLLAFLLSTCIAFPQNYNARLKVDPTTAGINQPIELQFSISEKPDKMIAPDLSNFTVIYEPDYYVEGPGESNNSSTYVYFYLVVPKHSGKIKIDAGTFMIGDAKYPTNNASITVTDTKVSFDDSAKVAEKYTGFKGNDQYTPNKTAVHYDNANTNPVSMTDAFTVTVDSTTIHAKAGEGFMVVYRIERNAANDKTYDEIEADKPAKVEGFSAVYGPFKSLQTQINSGRKIISGTITYKFVADKKGKYTIPVMQFKYETNSASSPQINVIVSE